jgi:hypothetical protein
MGLTAADTAVAAAIVGLYFLVLTLPLISLYLARVYKNIVHRPVFIVDQTRTCL